MSILSSAERQKLELFIESLIEQEIISQSDIEDYFIGNELSEQEKLTIDNLKNGKDLTLEEKTLGLTLCKLGEIRLAKDIDKDLLYNTIIKRRV